MLKKIIKTVTGKKISLTVTYSKPGCEFSGKRALIIGGTSGIGLAIAKKLKESGCEVVISGRNKIKEELDFFEWDVSKTWEIETKFSDVIQMYGGIDIVINSQGLNPEMDLKKRFLEITYKSFEEVFKVNLESVYFICIEAYKYFIKNNIKGNILNICSTEGLRAGVVPYGISKASVISLTRGFGKEFAKKGVICNGIAPGTTATKMINYDGNLSNGLQYTGRMNTTEEVANLAIFLVSDMARQMAGEIVVMDGGSTLR